jgi:hypothetical protein
MNVEQTSRLSPIAMGFLKQLFQQESLEQASLMSITLRTPGVFEFRHEPYSILPDQIPTIRLIALGVFDGLLAPSARKVRVRRRLLHEIHALVQRHG